MARTSVIKGILRRLHWLQHRPAPRGVANGLRNLLAFTLRLERAGRLPSLVKIDISPQCNLACPHCLHADPVGRARPLLDAQVFGKNSRMSVDQFAAIVEQLRGRVLAVSLFYYGDPLMHPDLDTMIRIARAAELAVHITTHFSYPLQVERIRQLVDAGLSHITVAVDGASQETYGVTRVRGRLDRVLGNLKALLDYKREGGLTLPYVEVQHLEFPHHLPGEKDAVRRMVMAMGVDHWKCSTGQRFDSSGALYNVVDDYPSSPEGEALPNRPLPRCHWPYSSAVIKFDGEVIPCCLWRVGKQYIPGEATHALGNIFETPLAEMWNGPGYRALRRRVSYPAAGRGDESFCDGCPKLCRSVPGPRVTDVALVAAVERPAEQPGDPRPLPVPL